MKKSKKLVKFITSIFLFAFFLIFSACDFSQVFSGIYTYSDGSSYYTFYDDDTYVYHHYERSAYGEKTFVYDYDKEKGSYSCRFDKSTCYGTLYIENQADTLTSSELDSKKNSSSSNYIYITNSDCPLKPLSEASLVKITISNSGKYLTVNERIYARQ
ncbi:MAG: hypothetical protein K5873_12225 [Treponema sp.]|nr:hypothetical protein [Treponema sp.]